MTTWNQFAEAATLAALNSLWQSAGIAGAVWLAFRIVKSVNAATRHAVWWAALAVIVILPLLVLPNRSAPPSQPSVPAARTLAISPPAPTPRLLGQTVYQPHEVRAGAFPAVVMSGWILLSALLLSRILWSALRLRGLINRCAAPPEYATRRFELWLCGRRASLLMSGEIASPMACGLLRPLVVLPSPLLGKLSEAELDHILLHEIAHVARRDQWTNLLARVTGALLALHPVAAWVLRHIERERELACDEWVVAATGAPRPYAATLARLFELCRGRRRELLATGMAQTTSRLGERIETLVAATYSARPGASWRRLAVAVAMLLLCLVISAAAPRWLAFAQSAPRPSLAPPVTGHAPANSLLAALVASGYGDLPVDDIISLKNHGIGANFMFGMQQSGWGKLSVPQLIAIHDRGVPPDFMKAIRHAGIENLTVPDAIALRDHGVDPADAIEIHALGFGPWTANQMIEIRSHGVRLELFRALQENGMRNLTVRDVIEAQASGLGAGNLREAKQYGPNLTLRQVIRLKRAGVI